jgi:arylsulfatase
VSNTPFRYYKRWVHEGGIAAPFVIHWPAGELAAGAILDRPQQLVDVMPTILEITGAAYPARNRGQSVQPLEGRSMLSILRGDSAGDETPLYWEHAGNAAIRRGRWKLVREYPRPWELYDLVADRSELHDVSGAHADIVRELEGMWEAWATRIGVKRWSAIIDYYADALPHEEAALSLEYLGLLPHDGTENA